MKSRKILRDMDLELSNHNEIYQTARHNAKYFEHFKT